MRHHISSPDLILHRSHRPERTTRNILNKLLPASQAKSLHKQNSPTIPRSGRICGPSLTHFHKFPSKRSPVTATSLSRLNISRARENSPLRSHRSSSVYFFRDFWILKHCLQLPMRAHYSTLIFETIEDGFN